MSHQTMWIDVFVNCEIHLIETVIVINISNSLLILEIGTFSFFIPVICGWSRMFSFLTFVLDRVFSKLALIQEDLLKYFFACFLGFPDFHCKSCTSREHQRRKKAFKQK